MLRPAFHPRIDRSKQTHTKPLFYSILQIILNYFYFPLTKKEQKGERLFESIKPSTVDLNTKQDPSLLSAWRNHDLQLF